MKVLFLSLIPGICMLPGKTGLPFKSSPSIQPLDHMSTPKVYCVDPSSISGALYRSGKSKVSKFDLTLRIEQQVTWLNVSMKQLPRMHELQSFE